MQRKILRRSSCLILIMLFLFGEGRSLATTMPPPNPNAVRVIGDMRCPAHVPGTPYKLTEAIYDCVKGLTDDIATTIVQNVYTKASKVVTAVLILSILFFSIKFVLYGTRQPQAEFFITLIKFTVVASLLFGIETNGGIIELRDPILDTAQELSNLVFTAGEVTTISGDNVFAKMDMLIFKLYGIETGAGVATSPPTEKLPKEKDYQGLQMLGAMALTGPLGAKAFAEGTGVIALLVSSFMIALYLQVVALIALTFLFALSPIFLPLVLFQQTRPMFDKWIRQIISYSLQPMIVVAFLSIMLIILGELFGTFVDIRKKSAELENSPMARNVMTAFSTPFTLKSAKDKMGNETENQAVNTGSGFLQSFNDSTVAGSGVGVTGGGKQMNQLAFGMSLKDTTITVSPFKPEQINELLSEIMLLLITCAALFRFMREMPEWLSELAGGDRTVPNLYKSKPISEIDQRFNKK